MCLRPRIIINRRYLKLANNSTHLALELFAKQPDFYLKVNCGLCIECYKSYSRNWSIRLINEYTNYCKNYPKSNVGFVMLTISPKYYDDFIADPGRFVRLFLERYRKRYGSSFKHWITSEYGEKRGRLHLHMISFGMLCNQSELTKLWSYGWCSLSSLRGPQGITYVSKYVTKFVDAFGRNYIDKSQKSYRWISPGIGRSFCLHDDNRSKYFIGNKPLFVNVVNGLPSVLPRYYQDKIFSPIDLDRRRSTYLRSLSSLPQPPYVVHGKVYHDLKSYFSKIHELGGYPLILSIQFDLLSDIEKQIYFYGK